MVCILHLLKKLRNNGNCYYPTSVPTHSALGSCLGLLTPAFCCLKY